QRPTRVRPGVLHRRSRPRTRPDFSTRKLHARSLGHPTRWSRGGRPRVLPRPLSSTAATASPANGDLRAEPPILGHPLSGSTAALVFLWTSAYFCFQTMPRNATGKRSPASPLLPQRRREP